MRALKWICIGAAGVYLAALLFVHFAQRSFIYFPDTAPPPPELAADFGGEIVSINVEGIGKLSSIYVPPSKGAPVILFFHGNGGSAWQRRPQFQSFRDWGVGFLAVEYPGYGGNPGAPGEDAIFKTALANYDWLNAQGISPEAIVIYGNSLGSASAVYVAAKRDAAGLILTAPFTSALAMGQRRMKIFPVSLFMKDKFRSDLLMPNVDEPLLIIHGTADRTVPYEMGQQLLALHTGENTFIRIPGGQHYMWNTDMPENIHAALADFTAK